MADNLQDTSASLVSWTSSHVKIRSGDIPILLGALLNLKFGPIILVIFLKVDIIDQNNNMVDKIIG